MVNDTGLTFRDKRELNRDMELEVGNGNRNGLDSLQRVSSAHGRNGRDPAVDQEVCPDDVRRIVRREVNCQLCDLQRIGHPLAWIVSSEDVLNRLALLFAWEATEHLRVRRAWA